MVNETINLKSLQSGTHSKKTASENMKLFSLPATESWLQLQTYTLCYYIWEAIKLFYEYYFSLLLD